MKTIAVGLLALLLTPVAFATPPAAPIVTVGAGLKQLQFDWNYVPRAGHYEVWFRSNPGAAWAKFADTPSWRPRANVNVSAHLLHWVEARFIIKACNPSGCTCSDEISVEHLMRDTVGYFKSSTPINTGQNGLGEKVAMSEDGSTLAAQFLRRSDGAVIVFRKLAAGWAEEALLVPMAVGGASSGGHPPAPASFAINSVGTVIAVGYPQEVRPDTDPGESPDIGAVYLFRRGPGGWVQEQRLASSNSSTEDAYGRFVSLDASGTTLAISRRWGEGKTAGQANQQQGPVELFRHTEAGWVPLATVPVLDDRCYSIALSGDGRTLVRHCSTLVEVLRAPNWQRVADFPLPTQGMNEFHSPWPYERGITINFDGRSFAARSVKMDAGGVDFLASVSIYRERDTGWVQEASVRPGDWMPPGVVDESPGNYGTALSFSRDGRFLAVGSSTDQAIGSGVLYPPIESISDNRNGAVYVYERKPTGWRLRQFIKPNFPGYPYPYFGADVSLARNGKDLAVGAPGDASNALGIDGDQEDMSAPNRGTLWLY